MKPATDLADAQPEEKKLEASPDERDPFEPNDYNTQVTQTDPATEPDEPLVVDPVHGVPHGVHNAALVKGEVEIAHRDAIIELLEGQIAEQRATIEAFKSRPDAESFPAHIGAIAILAAVRLAHRFVDEMDNEAERQSNGSVRLSIKQPGGAGHERLYVRVPETVELYVVDAPAE